MNKTHRSSKKLTIGFVFDDSLDKGDGVQQYILGLGKMYSELGHEVHYIVGQTERSDLPNIHSLTKNVKVSFNGNKMSMPLWAPKNRIKQLFQTTHFDVLHVQMPHSPFMAQRVISRAPKATKVIGTFHILPHSKLVSAANRLLRYLLLPSLKRLDQVISVSAAAQSFLQENWKLSSVVIPNHVNISQYMGVAPRKELQSSTNIMFLGRLVERKGCQVLLEAIKIVHRGNQIKKPFRVVICGKGPLDRQLREFVGFHGIGHLVEFAGFVSEDDKPSYLAAADVAVFPASGGESFGIVLIEAMASSRGVVLGGDNPGYRSVLGLLNEKQLFDTSKPDELARLLSLYLLSAEERKLAAQEQQQAVLQYDTKKVAFQLLDIYKK